MIKEKLDTKLALIASTQKEDPNHEKNRLVARDLCKDSFSFFCDNFVWIQDPEAEVTLKKDIPFLLYKYQEETAKYIIRAVRKGHDLPIEKSRKMGLSWLCIAVCIWGWHFHKWDILVGSQKAENVDKRGNLKSLLEKARYIIDKCPDWLMPKLTDREHDKNLLLVSPEHGATLAGESNNPNFGRSDRRKAILFDEFSSWEQTDKAAWQACSSTTKCRIPLSTPNTRGTNCHFYNIVQDAKKKEKPYVRLHWTLNPIFADGLYYDDLGDPHSPWYDGEVRRAASLQEVYQELDIDYEASMGGKVFPDFQLDVNVLEGLRYDPNLPLYVAWDFGLDTTAMLWIQTDKEFIYIIDEYENTGGKQGTDIYHYIDVLDSKGYKNAINYGDPHSGENRSLTSGMSNAGILKRYGIIFRSQRAKITNRVAAGKNLIHKLRVAETCTLAIEMFTSWQLRRPKTGNTLSQVPDHSEFSHIGEAFTYFALNYSERKQQIQKRQQKVYTPSLSGVVY